MDGRVRTQAQRFRRSLSLTGAIVATAVGVLLPVLLSTSVGIVALAIGKSSEATFFGVLVICFTAAASGSAIVVTVLLSRRHRLARLQADLVTNMTHELRTPLCAIRMYAQTLQMGRIKDNPELIAQSIDTILRETEWLESSIDRVLTWRAESRDRDEPEMISEPLQATIEGAVARFQRMLAPDEVDFEARFESDRPVLHDVNGIQSMTLNLLVNAYKYSGHAKTIRLRVFDSGPIVELWVEDNGIGIPRNEAGRIFDPFYRVDPRLRGKASGAGLGLAIVRHQVLLHRAQVFVESELNRGSKFIVQFPVHQPPATEET